MVNGEWRITMQWFAQNGVVNPSDYADVMASCYSFVGRPRFLPNNLKNRRYLIQHHFVNCYLVPGGFSLFVVFPDIVMVFLVAPSLVTTVFSFFFCFTEFKLYLHILSVRRQTITQKGAFWAKTGLFWGHWPPRRGPKLGQSYW